MCGNKMWAYLYTEKYLFFETKNVFVFIHFNNILINNAVKELNYIMTPYHMGQMGFQVGRLGEGGGGACQHFHQENPTG